MENSSSTSTSSHSSSTSTTHSTSGYTEYCTSCNRCSTCSTSSSSSSSRFSRKSANSSETSISDSALVSSDLSVVGCNSTSSSSEHFLKYVPELKLGAEGNDKIDLESLNKKILLLYFSAGWCATCKDFTPKLKKFYNASKEDVNILWISRDKSEREQKEYYAKSLDPTWMHVPLGKSTRDFLKLYKLAELPCVKLVDKDGTLIEEEVKKQIEENVDNPQDLVGKWKRQLNI